ncbi:hypothetical protein M569_08320, partial [Genlisea aurea]
QLAVFVSERVPEIVVGDPGRFRQVIINLVGNSVKFTEQGHIFVQVHLAEQTDSNSDADAFFHGGVPQSYGRSFFNTLSGKQVADDRSTREIFRHREMVDGGESHADDLDEDDRSVTLMVWVEDTGIGISDHAQKRVFTPFMQADSSTSRNYGGTGIGLSISKCLVELMGGQMNFASLPQIGSTFSFTVEFRRCHANEMKKSGSEDTPAALRDLKALVVDDKPVRAAVTRYHLRRLGIQSEAVNSFRTAIAMLGKKDRIPEIVLVEKDTWISDEEEDTTTATCGKNGESLFKPPKMILLATTNVTPGESDRAKRAGFADTVILKPLRAKTVAVCLHQVLGINKRIPNGTDPSRGSSSTGLHGLLCGKKILVVDDNVVNRRVAAGALKRYGADVTCAESGHEALKWLEIPHDFDACFMDIQMPEMDGFDATRLIREMERKATDGSGAEWHIPILAMTADVINATLDKCLKYGMDGYVSKPFQETSLYQAVAKFFDSAASSPN